MNLLFFSLAFAIIIIYSRRASRQVNSTDDYLLAGRRTRLFPLVATLVMTEFNTSTLISFSSMGYLAGYWALALPLVFLFGLLFYAFSVAKKWKGFNGLSVAHYFAERYGRDMEYFVAIILFIAMLGFSSTYIKSLTLIFLPIISLNQWLLSAILVATVVVLTIRGGLKSIIALDVCSFLFILVFFPLLVYFTHKLPQSQIVEHLSLNSSQAILPPKFILSLIFLTMFSYIIAPWYGQKIVAAESPRTAYIAAIIAAMVIFVLYALGIFVNGVLKYKGVTLANIELGFPYVIRHALPSGLQGVAYAVLFFIGASTLAGVWNAMVTLLVGSILKVSSRRDGARCIAQNNSKDKISNELIMLLIAIAAYLIANTLIDNILSKMILLNIPIVALSFALLGGFYWRKASRAGAYASIATGIVWGVFCYIHFGDAGLYTWYWAAYGIPMLFIVGIAVSLLIPHKKLAEIAIRPKLKIVITEDESMH